MVNNLFLKFGAFMNKKILALLSAAHLVTDINQGALPALLPFFKESMNLSYTLAGVILLFGNISSSVIQPAFGYFSDKHPTRWFLPVAPFVACLGLSITGFIPTYSLLLFFVVISGVGIASFHPEGYKTAYFFTGEKKATGMAIFSVGGNLGMALGPMIALSLVHGFGPKGTWALVLPGIVLAAVLLLCTSWHAPYVQSSSRRGQVEKKEPIARKAKISMVILIGIVIFRYWVQMGLLAYIPFYYINYLKGDPIYAGMLTTTFLMAGAAGTLIGSPMADRWGHRNILSISMILVAPLLLLFYNTSGWIVFVILAIIGMSLICTHPVTVVIAQTLLPQHLGTASGLTVGFAVGTGGVGVTLLGMVADAWGVPAAMNAIVVLPVLGFILSLFLESPPKKRVEVKS
jgi:MFS transporter, FSR family, fosmidomycin resistance protein